MYAMKEIRATDPTGPRKPRSLANSEPNPGVLDISLINGAIFSQMPNKMMSPEDIEVLRSRSPSRKEIIKHIHHLKIAIGEYLPCPEVRDSSETHCLIV
ncbi:hypothetical protein AHiyo8_59040 [Arthrobacter sp. Hiyo8]|nr:hypothetical protein AHiyo8_59040 [Arthrobacter sp. Hiyo8]